MLDKGEKITLNGKEYILKPLRNEDKMVYIKLHKRNGAC